MTVVSAVRPSPRRIAALLLCAALLALASPAAASAAFFEPEATFESGGTPTGLATDAAGRVYVANPSAGVVQVYDSAANGNKFLQNVGAAQLTSPVGVTVDNRSRIYVTDSAKGQGFQFDSLFDGAKLKRSFGFPGAALGQLGSPRQLDTDRAARVFVAERENARFQLFSIKGRDILPLDEAFGTTIGEVEGLTRDSKGRVFVSSDNPESGEVRALSEKGALIGTVAGPGEREEEDSNGEKLKEEEIEPAAEGRVNAPKQLTHDRLDRIIVADSLNDRIQAFGSLESGFAFLGAFGESGNGGGQLESPGGVAAAPGALLYIADTGNGRIVRVRMDDADADFVLDGGDNCPGLPNRDQRDADQDRVGDACDATSAPVPAPAPEPAAPAPDTTPPATGSAPAP